MSGGGQGLQVAVLAVADYFYCYYCWFLRPLCLRSPAAGAVRLPPTTGAKEWLTGMPSDCMPANAHLFTRWEQGAR
jgi:hypothetical protein